jgi:hypothetical protein
MLLAWVVFPLVLLALCVGLGLLVDSISGRRLPGALIPAVGMTAAIVVAQVTTLTDATAEATTPVLVVLAVLGGVLSRPWRFGRPDPLPIVAALGVFAVFAAPVVLSGEPTFLGYIKLDDTASWFTLTDHYLTHGHNFDPLAPSTYEVLLRLSSGYPIGAFLPFGVGAKLVGAEIAWLFQPYLALLMALLSLVLWELAGGLLQRSWLRVLVVFIAAQPALLFAYSLWGGIKELLAAVLLALVAALAPAVLRAGATWRDAVPLAISCGAFAASLSVAGLAWLGPMFLGLAAFAVHRLGVRDAARIALPFAALVVVLAVPVLIQGFSPPVNDSLTGEALGNLIAPLDVLQVVGIWPNGDFRLEANAPFLTSLLIASALVAAAIGLWLAWRRQGIALLLYATSLLAGLGLFIVANPWNAGKALASVAPIVLLLATAGAAAAIKRERLSAVLLAAIAAGVLWSNALAYHEVTLAPYDQLAELERIGEEIGGQGPALMTEYQPYGVRHFLRDADPEGVSELRFRPILRLDGAEVEKGFWEDTDGLNLPELLEYRTLILRHTPAASRPPSAFSLTDRGDYYDVWQQRPGVAGGIAEHLPLGDFDDPAAEPSCAEVVRMAGVAGPGGRLATVERRPTVVVPHTGTTDPGSAELSFTVPAPGDYTAYVLGSARNPIELSIDGTALGAIEDQRNSAGQFLEFGRVRLGRGTHSATIEVGGETLEPGSGAAAESVGQLVLDPTRRLAVTEVPSARARELCGRHLDWVEALP